MAENQPFSLGRKQNQNQNMHMYTVQTKQPLLVKYYNQEAKKQWILTVKGVQMNQMNNIYLCLHACGVVFQ